METREQIAVLILNWNKARDIITLLTDLDRVKNQNLFDVFVVDNASTDDSVKLITVAFPHVNLIVNKTNLGGTGGFNSGIQHIVQRKKYEYIWLLDNDARIVETTLEELLRVMEEDHNIGLAGSRIQDIDHPSMIVETGSNFRWDTIGVIPVNRNSKGDPKEIIEVDYVAICSALVRVNALKVTGIMDTRMFLCWDDMEWGLCFKENGFKVVAVCKSIAFHGSFTERDRGNVTNYYYGVRNALLAYSKHCPDRKRAKVFLSGLRFYVNLYFFFLFHGFKNEAGLICTALSDFYNNRWGRLENFDREMKVTARGKKGNCIVPEKILVSLIGVSFKNSMELLSQIEKRFPKSEIHILISMDRKNYFENFSKILIDTRCSNKTTYLLKLLFKLYRQKFKFVISVIPTPFIYSAPAVMFYDTEKCLFYTQKSGVFRLYRIILSHLLGEVFSFLIFPFILYKSYVYKNTTSKNIKS